MSRKPLSYSHADAIKKHARAGRYMPTWLREWHLTYGGDAARDALDFYFRRVDAAPTPQSPPAPTPPETADTVPAPAEAQPTVRARRAPRAK